MGRHAVIGTAGHVDHGKTALVKSLTGIDTDRWEEEKRRGITIDLGFAHFRLGDDLTASVVDVPGHEDFVRNMVAGATGIDVALLVVAADEGVMPQTIEHLAILEFLGIEAGVVAVTKADLADPEWLELVIDDVMDRLSHMRIRWEPAIAVSVKTGQGIDELRSALADAAERSIERTPNDLFRMPVDRAFSVAGAGTVVTGTTWAGTIRTGANVRLLPGDVTSRVRGVEVHGVSASQADPGRRTALALVGVDRAAAGRGGTVVSDDTWRATRRVDASVSLLPHARPLTQRSRIRVHVGTAEVMARITPAVGDVPAGGSGVVRLRLETPLVCRWGDRGVLRSYSPITTVGGFVVIDPWPAARPRRPSEHAGRVSQDLAERVAAFVHTERPGSVAVADLPVRLGVPPERVPGVVDGFSAVEVSLVAGRLFPVAFIENACKSALAAVADFHEEHPLQSGMPAEVFRRTVGEDKDEGHETADHVRQRLEREGKIEVEAGAVRLPGYRPILTGLRQEAAKAHRQKLVEAGEHGVTMAELAADIPGQLAQEVAEFLVRQGAAVRIGGDRYYDSTTLTEVTTKTVAEIERLGQASPADLREALGLSRKYLIPLLEWLDSQGITARVGDARRLGPNAHPLG